MISTPRDSEPGKPLRRLPRSRVLATLLAAAGVALIVLGFVLGTSPPRVDPAPPAGYGPAPAVPSPEGTEAPTSFPVPGAGASPLSTPVPESPPAAGAAPSAPAVPVVSGRVEDLVAPESPVPVRLRIAALGIDAPVQAVGVSGGEMEVPSRADAVGWYRYGPSPGQPGSAVLAAHVAWRGEAGAFYRLRDLPQGSRIDVTFADGSTARFQSVALESYPKVRLPLDRIFGREGPPVLTLVTCGGAVNPSLRTFADNVVAYAVPVEEAFE